MTITSQSIGGPKYDNQDRFFILDDIPAIGVFDGVGGSSDGAFAAELAKEYIEQCFKSLHPKAPNKQLLQDLLVETSKRIYNSDPHAGTTATVVWIVDGTAVIAHCGDSRAYKLTDGRLLCLTLDHSLGGDKDSQEAWRQQHALSLAKTEEDLRTRDAHAFEIRNQITSMLGGRLNPQTRGYLAELSAGDKLILTTDGVHDNLTHDEIETIVKEEGAEKLTEAALLRSRDRKHYRSKPDDITAVVYERT